MKLANFIVVDDTMSRNRDICTFTVNGDVIYPLETPLPVIRKGSGCIGIGIISSSTRKSTTTSITFKLSETSASAANAYYDLYRNQVSTGGSDDAYDTSDAIIPGMMVGSRKPSASKDNSRNRRGRGPSLSDIIRDNNWD